MLGKLWWNFATCLERFLPWRWTQALRHGPHNIVRWLTGYDVVWTDPRRGGPA